MTGGPMLFGSKPSTGFDQQMTDQSAPISKTQRQSGLLLIRLDH
jgi:hypothetical protein